jgi:hypothetical protein
MVLTSKKIFDTTLTVIMHDSFSTPTGGSAWQQVGSPFFLGINNL